MATMKRPEVEGKPVYADDVLIDGATSVTVALACEQGYVYCTDGSLRIADTLRWPTDSADDLMAEIMGGTTTIQEAVEKLQALVVSDWAVGVAYEAGAQVVYEDTLYTCIQAHTSQADWTPDKTPSLWKLGRKPDEIPEWVQPTGAHDAYAIGDKVRHSGSIWESLVDGNVWEPSDAVPTLWEKVG